MPTKHSILGASGASRWMACPGSIRLSENLPKSSSPYAIEGTAAHELGEMCLRTKTDAKDYLGSRITVEGTVITVDEEMVDAVQLYLDTIREDLAEAGPHATLVIEQRFHLDWLYPGLFGTLDAMICEPFGTARCYDFKYGKGLAVDVYENAQLLYYVAGGTEDQAYEDAEMVIVQPRAYHPDGPVRRQEIDLDDLKKWANEKLLPAAQATEAPDAPLKTGPHCRFCPALALCPAQRELATTVAKEVFAEKPAALPIPTVMTNEQLRKVLEAADGIEDWLNACRIHAHRMLESGRVKPEEIGHKLVAGRASRAWTSEDTARTRLIKLLGNDAYVTKLVSPAQAEKLVKGPEKAALGELVTTTRGVQMVHVSDKREAVRVAITFDEV